MNHRILPILMVAGAFALGGAAPASAAIVDFTFTGTLSYGFLEANNFEQDITGQAASITFAVNTATGNSYGYTGSNLPYNAESYVYGGSDYGNTSPIVSVTLNVGGQSYSGGASQDGVAELVGEPGFNEIYGEAYQSTSAGTVFTQTDAQAQIYNYNESLSPFATVALTGPLNYTVQPGDNTYIYFSNEFDNSATGAYADQYGQLNATSVTISAVPEPATWAMMIIGFAGVGFAGLRMRRREPAAA